MFSKARACNSAGSMSVCARISSLVIFINNRETSNRDAVCCFTVSDRDNCSTSGAVCSKTACGVSAPLLKAREICAACVGIDAKGPG